MNAVVDDKTIAEEVQEILASNDASATYLEEWRPALRDELNRLVNKHTSLGSQDTTTGTPEQLAHRHIEIATVGAAIEQLRALQTKLNKRIEREHKREAIRDREKLQAAFAKSMAGVVKAHDKFQKAISEAEDAMRTLDEARSRAVGIHGDFERADDQVIEDVKAACALFSRLGREKNFKPDIKNPDHRSLGVAPGELGGDVF